MGTGNERGRLRVKPAYGVGFAYESPGVLPPTLIDISCPPTLSLSMVGARHRLGITVRVADRLSPAILDTGPAITLHARSSPTTVVRVSRIVRLFRNVTLKPAGSLNSASFLKASRASSRACRARTASVQSFSCPLNSSASRSTRRNRLRAGLWWVASVRCSAVRAAAVSTPPRPRRPGCCALGARRATRPWCGGRHRPISAAGRRRAAVNHVSCLGHYWTCSHEILPL